jgi:hypothetical protein
MLFIRHITKIILKDLLCYISQDSSTGRTLISCINSGNSNFSPGFNKKGNFK